VRGINGSGRCPSGLTIDRLQNEFGVKISDQDASLPPTSVHTVTVPGAARCWEDTLKKFGTMDFQTVLQPAIDLAEKGFPVSPISSHYWQKGSILLHQFPHAHEMLLNGKAPKPGELMKNPTLAQTFRELQQHGSKGFYEGRVAQAIVDIHQSLGGTLTLDDLKSHTSTLIDEPIHVNYRGIDVWEIPPNGQGITALMALKVLEGFDLSSLHHNSPQYLHLLIESLRIAFADTRYYVADAEKVHVPIKEMLSSSYAASRRTLINPNKANPDITRGYPENYSSTVYFSIVDGEGNACSFINSNYMGFGTGIIPKGCGFTLQNRGANFSLVKGHPNALEPGKRPYHTIIPGMATKDGELWASFGVMGGFMQPQGHVQVLCNMIDHGMDPQAALDASRFIIMDGTRNGQVYFEEGISQETIQALKQMGHHVEVKPLHSFERSHFGRGQIIRRDPSTGVLIAGSDMRADGQAVPL